MECASCAYWVPPSGNAESDQVNEGGLRFPREDLGTCLGLPPIPIEDHRGRMYFQRSKVEACEKGCVFWKQV